MVLRKMGVIFEICFRKEGGGGGGGGGGCPQKGGAANPGGNYAVIAGCEGSQNLL